MVDIITALGTMSVLGLGSGRHIGLLEYEDTSLPRFAAQCRSESVDLWIAQSPNSITFQDDMSEGPTVQRVEDALGYRFTHRSILEQALTHRSFANEVGGSRHRGELDNERLEFLGDAMLGFSVASLLYEALPMASEGELTRRRSMLVCEASLAEIARKIGVPEAIRLGKGESKTGGNEKPRLLASALEACVGAVYLDGGPGAAHSVVKELLSNDLTRENPAFSDFKSRLQEELQGTLKINPNYRIICTKGPDHARIFEVGVWAGKELLAQAEGRSRMQAEQSAAKKALSQRGSKAQAGEQEENAS